MSTYYDERRIDITNKCTHVIIDTFRFESCCCIFPLLYHACMKRRSMVQMNRKYTSNNSLTLPILIAGRVASVVIPTMIYSYIILCEVVVESGRSHG